MDAISPLVVGFRHILTMQMLFENAEYLTNDGTKAL